MQFKIYAASGIGNYFISEDQDKPCKNAFLNGSKDGYPFSVELNTAQDFIDLIDEAGDIVMYKRRNGAVICIYDDYIE